MNNYIRAELESKDALAGNRDTFLCHTKKFAQFTVLIRTENYILAEGVAPDFVSEWNPLRPDLTCLAIVRKKDRWGLTWKDVKYTRVPKEVLAAMDEQGIRWIGRPDIGTHIDFSAIYKHYFKEETVYSSDEIIEDIKATWWYDLPGDEQEQRIADFKENLPAYLHPDARRCTCCGDKVMLTNGVDCVIARRFICVWCCDANQDGNCCETDIKCSENMGKLRRKKKTSK